MSPGCSLLSISTSSKFVVNQGTVIWNRNLVASLALRKERLGEKGNMQLQHGAEVAPIAPKNCQWRSRCVPCPRTAHPLQKHLEERREIPNHSTHKTVRHPQAHVGGEEGLPCTRLSCPGSLCAQGWAPTCTLALQAMVAGLVFSTLDQSCPCPDALWYLQLLRWKQLGQRLFVTSHPELAQGCSFLLIPPSQATGTFSPPSGTLSWA